MLRALTIVAAFTAVVALIMALAACSNENDIEAKSPPEIPVEAGSADTSDGGVSSASSGENRSEAGDDKINGGNGESGDDNDNGSSGGGSSQPASQDSVSSFTNPNPNGNGITLNTAPNDALKDTQPPGHSHLEQAANPVPGRTDRRGRHTERRRPVRSDDGRRIRLLRLLQGTRRIAGRSCCPTWGR